MNRFDHLEQGIDCWRPVRGFEDVYKINFNGQIVNIRRPTKIMKQQYTTYSMSIILIKEGRRKNCSVAKLMYESWHKKEIPDDMMLYHKNGIRTDNILTNIALIPKKHRNVWAARTARRSVVKRDLSGKILEIYPSVTVAAKKEFCSAQTMGYRCKTKCKIGNFVFEYDERM